MFTVTRTTAVLLALAGGTLMGSCASEGPRPVEDLTRARTLVDAADKGGTAQRYAAADLQRAHDELANATSADSAGKFDEARTFAQSAAADANVAAARGAAAEAERSAHEVAQSNASVQTEANRAADASTTMPAPPPPQ
jgi:hypothetical protein